MPNHSPHLILLVPITAFCRKATRSALQKIVVSISDTNFASGARTSSDCGQQTGHAGRFACLIACALLCCRPAYCQNTAIEVTPDKADSEGASQTGQRQAKEKAKPKSKPKVQRVYELMDRNGDGKLDMAEYVQGSVGRAAMNEQAEFQRFDEDHDGALSLDEFRRRGRKPGVSDLPGAETAMKKLDTDRDGRLTLPEYLADKHDFVAAKRMFFFCDVDEDELLTLDELKQRAAGVTLTQKTLFKMRDDNDDGKLTLKEFNLWRTVPDQVRAGESQFKRYDEDGDGILTFEEFPLTATAAAPSLEAAFKRRDSDNDSRVTPEELTNSMNEPQAVWARDTFAEFDTDNDGALDFAEFKARQEELERRYHARQGSSLPTPEGWAWWKQLLVAVGVLAALLILWQLFRRLRRSGNASGLPESPESRPGAGVEPVATRPPWGIGLLAVLAVALTSLLLCGTAAEEQPEATVSIPAPTLPEPTEFEAVGRSLEIHVPRARSIAFSHDGHRLAAAHGDRDADGVVRIWDMRQKRELASWLEPKGIYSVHISADGRLVASSSQSDNLVRIRDIESGTEILKIATDDKPARVRFSPDGTTLATASTGGELKLWNVKSGKELKSLASLAFNLQCVAFSRDGARIVAGGGPFLKTRNRPGLAGVWDSFRRSRFGWAGVWEIASGKLIAEMKAMPDSVLGIAISSDAKQVATAGHDGVARLWEVETSKLISTFVGHQSAVEWVDFSPDGKMLASGSYDDTARLWSVDSGQEVAKLLGHDGDVMTTRFSPDGKMLASAGGDGVVRLWDVATQQQVDLLHPRMSAGDVPQPVLALAHSPNQELVASAHEDKKTIKSWKSQRPRIPPLATLQAADEGVRCRFGVLSPDGRLMITAGDDKFLRVWNVQTGRLLRLDEYRGGTAICGDVSPDGKLLATGTYSDVVHLWDVAAGMRVGEIATGERISRMVDFSPDGSRLAVSSGSKTVSVWDVASRRKLWVSTEQSLEVMTVVFSPDGKTLATTTGDWKKREEPCEVKLWDADSGAQLALLPLRDHNILRAVFSPNGRLLVTSCSTDATLKIWDVESRRLDSTISTRGGVSCLACLPGGGWVVAGQYSQGMSLCDVDSGQVLAEYVDPAGPLSVQDVSCSPDGLLIAGVNTDGTITLWPTTGTPPGTVTVAGPSTAWPIGELLKGTQGRQQLDAHQSSVIWPWWRKLLAVVDVLVVLSIFWLSFRWLRARQSLLPQVALAQESTPGDASIDDFIIE